MAANSHLVLMNGPPFSGREYYIKQHFSQTHLRVCPEELFEKDSSAGLRDVILSVVNQLKKGNKVVVDDENSAASTRKSYINLIDKKVPAVKNKALVTIRPKYAHEQIFWSREFTVADQIESVSAVKTSLLSDCEINKWYHSDDLTSIKYQPGIVDKPTRHEGFTLYEEDLPLTIHSKYKFELPVLFLQWEGIIQKKDDCLSLHKSVVRLCELWSEVNPWGRIIVICDGASGETLETEHIKTVLYQLVQDFHFSPVYVLQVTDQTDSGSYTRPPKPGLLAFLQKRHHLDLQSKSTLYLYHDQSHKEMADAAGVQSIKISKVLQNQSLVLTPQVATRPVIPSFLKTMNLQKSDSNTSDPTIPLYKEMSKFTGRHLYKQLGFGRSEFIFALDTDCIKRYQSLYTEFATPVDEPVSRIQEIIKSRDLKRETQSKTPLRRSSLNTSSSSNRDLPKWMIGTAENDKTKSSLSRSESSSSTDGKIKQTVYVMTERELVEVATDILKQAGREDILNEISQQKLSGIHSGSKNISTQHAESSQQPQPGTSKQNVIISATVEGDSSKTKINTCERTAAPACEPLPGTSKQHMCVKRNLIGSSDEVSEWDTQNETNILIGDSGIHHEAYDLLSKSRKSKPNTTVLDSIMDEDYTRKRSPNKKRRTNRLLETETEMTPMKANENLFDEVKHSKTDDFRSEQTDIQNPQSEDLSEGRQNFTVLCDTSKYKETEETKTLSDKSKQKSSSHKSHRKRERDFSVLDEIFN